MKFFSFNGSVSEAGSRATKQIEDHVNGYPRFSALIASHAGFHVCRRFAHLRSRLLLVKQNKLSELEAQLEKTDREEANTLNLGSCGRDANPERLRVLGHIDDAMADYDKFIQSCHQIVSLNAATPRGISSLKNWTEAKGCIARDETKYLSHEGDMMNISTSTTNDDVLERLEGAVGTGISRAIKGFRARPNFNISRDPNVYVYKGSALKRTVRVVIVLLIDALLFVPVIIINELERPVYRLIVILVACAIFISTLSAFARARTSEIFIAGATYSAILVVFLVGSPGSNGAVQNSTSEVAQYAAVKTGLANAKGIL